MILIRKRWIKARLVWDQFYISIGFDFSEKKLWIGLGFLVIVIGDLKLLDPK
jgi:hypothetical protein